MSDLNNKTNQQDQLIEIIEEGNIKLVLDKQKSDELNILYNTTINYEEFKSWALSQKINGFRPGVVPFTEENQNKFLNTTLSKIIPSLKINNFYSINYIKEIFEENKPIQIIVSIEKMPTIPNIDFSEYKIKQYTSNIEHNDILKAIELFSTEHAKPSNLILDLPAKIGDFIKIEITNTKTAQKEIQEVRLNNEKLNSKLVNQLVGQKTNFTTIYKMSEDLLFEIKILEIKEAINLTKEEIANHLKLENKEQIEYKFKEELTIHAGNISKNLIIESILRIIAELDFNLPISVLNKEYRSTYSNTLFNLQYNKNIELESFIQNKLNISLNEFEEKMKKGAMFNAKIKFFLNYFSYQNQFSASEEEINNAIEARSKYFKNGIIEAKEHFSQNTEARTELLESIIHQKSLDKIKGLIQIEETISLSFEELGRIDINILEYKKDIK